MIARSPHPLGAAMAAALALAGDVARADPPEATPSAAPSAPGESPPAEAPRAAPPSQAGPDRDPAHDTWIDVGHSALEGFLGNVLEVDRFFSDERDLDPIREKSFVRWRTEILGTTARRPRFGMSLSASLRFPALERELRERFRLVVSGISEDTTEGYLAYQRAQAEANPPPPGRILRDASAELRYGVVSYRGFGFDSAAGVLLKLPIGAVFGLRARYALPFRDVLLARAAVTGFWRTDLHLGATGSVDLQRALWPGGFVRLGGSGTTNQVQRALGIQWSSELAVLHALSPLSAFTVGVASEGVTRPVVRALGDRVYVRYRRDVFRRWLFAEVEPQVVWALDPAGVRQRAFGGFFRLEVQFYGDLGERRPYEPDPRNPEPPDPP